MKFHSTFLAAVVLTVAATAHAAPLNIIRKAKVVTADGQTIGVVDRVLTGADKNVTGIRLIVGTRMVTLQAEQLSVDGDVVKTKLTRKEVERSQ